MGLGPAEGAAMKLRGNLQEVVAFILLIRRRREEHRATIVDLGTGMVTDEMRKKCDVVHHGHHRGGV